jgi:hypothetical protein
MLDERNGLAQFCGVFKIIGADRKPYGPVTADQVRQWIADGRADGQTLAQLEGTAEWKPLKDFSEFADLFPPQATPPPLPGPTQTSSAPKPPTNYMLPAVLSTLCCCLPFGIPAIIFAARAQSKWASGDWAGAVALAEKARLWCWIAFVVGAISQALLSWYASQMQLVPGFH